VYKSWNSFSCFFLSGSFLEKIKQTNKEENLKDLFFHYENSYRFFESDLLFTNYCFCTPSPKKSDIFKEMLLFLLNAESQIFCYKNLTAIKNLVFQV
jgi:hypothetical protein